MPEPRAYRRIRPKRGTRTTEAKAARNAQRRAVAAARRARTREATTVAARQVREASARLRVASRDALASIPPEARREIGASLWRLRKIRSPQQALAAFEQEIETLLNVVTPLLAEHPLPVRRAGTARVVVAGGAAVAATGEQLEVIVGIFSEGATIPATLPIALAAVFLSLVLELYVATSLRVNTLRSAGAVVDPRSVTAEVAWAMGGAAGRPARVAFTRTLVTRVSARVLVRLGRGLVPVAGAAYSAWDAQRTVAAISSLGVPLPPQRVNPVKPSLPPAE